MEIIEHNKNKTPKKSLLYPEKISYDPRPECNREVTYQQKQSFLLKVRGQLPKAVINLCSLPPPNQDVPPN